MCKLVCLESSFRLLPKNKDFNVKLGGNFHNNERHIEQLHGPLPQDRQSIDSR